MVSVTEVDGIRGYWGLKGLDCVRTRSRDVLMVAVAAPGLLETFQRIHRLHPLMYQNQIPPAIQQI